MKIELVGGPRCGDVVEVEYLNAAVKFFGREWPTEVLGERLFEVLVYQRRDRPFTLDQRHEDFYSSAGHRLYDHVYEQAQSSDS